MFDEVVGGEEGEGPEDFEDQANQGKQPFDHVYETFLCMPYSSLLLLHRNHDEMVNHVGWLPRLHSSLILALCMALPSYEGYAGGST